MSRARLAARLVAASILSGLMLGIGARFVMRIVGLAAGLPGNFSWAGSFEVVILGLFVGSPVALAFLVFRRRLPIPAPWAGIACGLLVFLALCVVPPRSPQTAFAGAPGDPWVTVTAFAALFALWGVGLDLVNRSLKKNMGL